MQAGRDAVDNAMQLPITEIAAASKGGVPSPPSPTSNSPAVNVDDETKSSRSDQSQQPVKGRTHIAPSPTTVLRYFEAIIRPPNSDDKMLSAYDQGSMEKGPFQNSESFATADVLRAIMDQPDFRQVCNEAAAAATTTGGSGAPSEDGSSSANWDPCARCYPDGLDSATTREYVRELIAWQKSPKSLAEFAAGSRPFGLNPSAARGKDHDGRSAAEAATPSAPSGNTADISSVTVTEKLSSSTIEEVSRHLLAQTEGSGQGSIADASLIIRRMSEASATAASQLLIYDDKKHRSQVQEQLEGRGRDGSSVSTRLQNMKYDRLQGLSKYLGISCPDADGVYRAVSGIGALLLFSSLPLETLRKCCKELGIHSSEDSSMDPHLLPETLAEKISSSIYPSPTDDRVSLAHIQFLPRLQVHECSVGSYICSIENARNIGQLPLERYTSNRFSCSKVKWRCLVQAKKGTLHLFVWHRHPAALKVQLTIRTAENKKKKKKSADQEVVYNEADIAPPLFSEAELIAEPNELVGISDFVVLDEALASSTAVTYGLRTYNPAEDRLVFQLFLTINGIHNIILDNHSRSTGMTRTPTELKLQRKETFDDFHPQIDTRKTSSVSSLDGERIQEESARVLSDFLCDEEASRQTLSSSWHSGYRQLQYAEYREFQRAKAQTRDRERKALLVKAGPSPELIRDIEKTTTSVTAARLSVSKLQKEKSAEEKEHRRLLEKLEENRIELERLRVVQEGKAAELSKLETEISEAHARQSQKQRAMEVKTQRRREMHGLWHDVKEEPPLPHDALAISDFNLFLNSTGPAPSEHVFHTSHTSLPNLDPHSESYAFSTRQVRSPEAMTSASAPPVFSTQPNARGYHTAGGGMEHLPPSITTLREGTGSPLNRTPTPRAPTPSGSLPINSAFGSIGAPSPFSTNPVSHSNVVYAQMGRSPPGFHGSIGGEHMVAHSPQPHGLDSSHHHHHPQHPHHPHPHPHHHQPMNAFTVTAGAPAPLPGGIFPAFQTAEAYPGERTTPPAQGHIYFSEPMPHADPFSSAPW